MKGNITVQGQTIQLATATEKRNRLWTWLFIIKREYQALPSTEVDYDLWEYIEANYGVRVIRDHDSMITGEYVVVDQEKFFVSKLAGLSI